MYCSYNDLRGYSIAARDGEIGHITDLYFGDLSWQIRYMVINLGPWIFGRTILLNPVVFKDADHQQRLYTVDLSKEQIRQSPPSDMDQPVSRQHEQKLSRYFGWPSYWSGAPNVPLTGVGRVPLGLQEEQDSHLRSAREVKGYSIHAIDGTIGDVTDFILDENLLLVKYVVVDTGSWLSARKVLVARQWMDWISWDERLVGTYLSRHTIEQSPLYDPDAGVSEEYLEQLNAHYNAAVPQYL